MFDLKKSADRKALTKEIKLQIDNYCQREMQDSFRTHLGASIIGHECSRYLYLSFRWFFIKEFDGRMLRLFERGHLEEKRLKRWLVGIGFKVIDKKEPILLYHAESDCYFTAKSEYEAEFYKNKADKEGFDLPVVNEIEQHRLAAEIEGVDLSPIPILFSAVNGHFGGTCDSEGYFPEFLNIKDKIGFEFKTNGTGSSFTNLFTQGVSLVKPEHDAQMHTYGYYFGWEYCVYLNTNKNDDDIYPEILPINKNLGEAMIQKADKIINAKTPPEKLSLNPAFYKCTFCDAKDVCHNGKLPLKNCRTCIHSEPVANAEWFCAKHSPLNGNVPKEIQMQGCNDWEPIKLNTDGLI